MSASPPEDERFMAMAVEAALQGRYTAHPNPIVGAVIVRDGEVLATGYHARAGQAHAERVAIDAAGDVRGATMYVTLEPCSHHGRTAPCSDAVIESGLARVVAGTIDPNPRVSGRGVAAMQAAGIDVSVGVLADRCWRMNEDFMVAIRSGRPMVTAKVATSLDGRIATRANDSKWISSEGSRRRVHQLRRDTHAILVGTNTVLQDDPQLTTRLADEPDARCPHRYVLDADLRIPLGARVFDVAAAPTTVVSVAGARPERRAELEARGVEVLEVDRIDGRLELDAVFASMNDRGYLSVLVEGGGELLGRLRDAGLVDRLVLFVAPLLIGGRDAVPAFAGLGVERVAQATRAQSVALERIDDDIVITADFNPHLAPPIAG